MPVSLATAAPVALATLAYLQAKTQIGDDLTLIRTLVTYKLRGQRAQARDRVNLFYTLEEHAKHKTRGKSTFLIYEGREWTFKQTYDTVLSYATWMKCSYDVCPGEIVALDSMNTHRFVFVWLALWSLGAHPAFINYNLTGEPLLHSIRASSARLVFVDDEIKATFTPTVLAALADVDFRKGKGPSVVIDLDDAFERNAEATIGIREPDTTRSGATVTSLAILIFTSGTTGLPKAAFVAWIKLYSAQGIAETWMGLAPPDRFYTCMPLYHSTASILGATPCLCTGTTLVLGHRFSNRTFWPDVRASGATIIQYVGETCRYLLAAPPILDPISGANLDSAHQVRLAFGNGMRPDVWERFKARFAIPAIGEFYSATEGAGSFWNLSRNASSAGAIGRFGLLGRFVSRQRHALVAHDLVAQCPLRDPSSGLCSRVALDTPGELLYALDARNPNVDYQGYWGNASASAAKLLRGVFAPNDAWFATGDLVREDANGCLWFCDRVGDTFRWKGENVATSEVAEALGQHASVVEANVYGVALPHHDGRAGCAAITLSEPLTPSLLRALAAHVTATLPRYAVPLFVRVTQELAATGNNKQQKHALREAGVAPGNMRGDCMFWLRGDTYVPFGEAEWKRLTAAQVKL